MKTTMTREEYLRAMRKTIPLHESLGITPMQLFHWAKNGWLSESGTEIRPGTGKKVKLNDTEVKHAQLMAGMVNELRMHPEMASSLAWRLLEAGSARHGDFEIRRITDGGVQLQ